MIGAIIGDIAGSIYEHKPIQTKKFPLFGTGATFTDDTVCTVAVADWLLTGGDLADHLRAWVRRHPRRGYGGMFLRWAFVDDLPAYGSWGNGSAMRVGPVGHTIPDLDTAMRLAERSAVVTHDHLEAIRGAQAVAVATHLALSDRTPEQVREAITTRFGYDLDESVDGIRSWYTFDVSCAGTVPPAIVCAVEATGFEDAIRNAVSLGGDSDTLACITGGIAEALYGVPEWIAVEAKARLDADLLAVIERFVSEHR
jgi:ADP-ribosylglycohydrolase